MLPPELVTQAAKIIDAYREQRWKIATAESCTGGLVAALLTELPGSSDVFERGFVTYSNEAKAELLGVKPSTLAENGAVSPETAVEMALGTVAISRANVAVSVTGIAGPGGGSDLKPVGLVYLASAQRDGDVRVIERHYAGDRNAIRRQAAAEALTILQGLLDKL